MLEEIQLRQDMLRSEVKLRKGSRFSIENYNEHSDEINKFYIKTSKTHTSSENSEESLCEHKCSKQIEFSSNGVRHIQRGSCISKRK